MADADRKKRIEAACQVGAAFVRRRVLRRWRQFALESRRPGQPVGHIHAALEGDPRLDEGAAVIVELEEGLSDEPDGDGEAASRSESSEDTDEDDEAETIEYVAEDSDDDDDANEQTLAAIDSAFTAWRQWTRAVGFRNDRLISAVWKSWHERTLMSAHKELMRRRAVRFAYLRAFRRALSRFRSLVGSRHARRVSISLQAWKAHTSVCLAKRQHDLAAMRHAERQLMRRVLKRGFGSNASINDAKRMALLRADSFRRMQMLRTVFKAWSAFCEIKRHHNHELRRLLEVWRASPSTHRRCEGNLRLLITYWADYAHSKSVARLVVANFRGRAHLRVLRECFDEWVSHVSRIRWRQIKRERAQTHLRRVTLRKSFAKWRERVAAVRNARNQVRTALVHWKMSVEKRFFTKWIAYLDQKHEKRQHIHDALQFRHLQLVTHGVRHWLTAAMHLQEVRESHSARIQAAHTAGIWRRVASIARHWKLLTARRRRERIGSSSDQPWAGSGMSRVVPNDDADWLVCPQHQRLLPVESRAVQNGELLRGGKREYLGRGSEYSLETSTSPLSEFVMLPRNRPQPRKPVELLLFPQQQGRTEEAKHQSNLVETEETKIQGGSYTNGRATTNRPRELARYGFQFPVEMPPSTAPEDSMGGGQVHADNREQRTQVKAWRRGNQAIGTFRAVKAAVPPSASSFKPAGVCDDESSKKYAALLDALEQQLLRLQMRKHEWREFQQRLADLRASNSSADEHRQQQQFEAQVLDMEREYHTRHRDWHDAQQRLRVVAAELAELRQVLQPQVSS